MKFWDVNANSKSMLKGKTTNRCNFVIKKKESIIEWEYILSGGGVKELLYAPNNKAPHHITTLNLIHLVTHDYNPHSIPKPSDVLLFGPFFSLIPLIFVSLSLSSKPSDNLLPAPTPPLICHHPMMMLRQLAVHFSHPPLFIR